MNSWCTARLSTGRLTLYKAVVTRTADRDTETRPGPPGFNPQSPSAPKVCADPAARRKSSDNWRFCPSRRCDINGDA